MYGDFRRLIISDICNRFEVRKIVEACSCQLNQCGENIDVLILRAKAYCLLCEDENVHKDLDHILRLNPGAAIVHMLRAFVYFKNGSYPLANEVVNFALNLEPYLLSARLLRIELFLQSHNIDEAQKEVEFLMQQGVESEYLYELAATVCFFNLDFTQVRLNIEAVWNKGYKSARSHTLLANIHLLECHSKLAYQSARQAVRIDNNYMPVHDVLQKIACRFFIDGRRAMFDRRFNDAIEHFNIAVSINDRDIDSLKLLAEAHLIFGQDNRALKIANKVIQLIYHLKEPFFCALTKAFIQNDSVMVAINHEAMLKIDRQNVKIYEVKAAAEWLSRNYQEALKSVNISIAIIGDEKNERYFEMHLLKSEIHFALRQYELAKEEACLLLEFKSKDADCYAMLAKIDYAEKKYQDAIKCQLLNGMSATSEGNKMPTSFGRLRLFEPGKEYSPVDEITGHSMQLAV